MTSIIEIESLLTFPVKLPTEISTSIEREKYLYDQCKNPPHLYKDR